MSKVSIIIPVYNAEKYLAATLDSVLSQTLQDIEVVCVDDGSTDSSAEILKQYQKKDTRVKVVTQKNGGGSAARNTGIKQATSDYIMFLDSDDRYANTIVEDAYKRTLKVNADIVFYNFARFVGKPTKMAVINKNAARSDAEYFTKETYADRLFNDFAIITWNKLIKKSVLTKSGVRFDTKLSHNHDVDFSIRLMLAAESYSWLDQVGYYYRSNDAGLTATRRSDPTNVLKILLDLEKLVATKYPELKASFDNYVVDMVAGTVLKYRGDAGKVREVCEFSHDTLIPQAGLRGLSEPSGIFTIIETGEYEKVDKYIHHPNRKLRVYLRNIYNAAQGVLARFTV